MARPKKKKPTGRPSKYKPEYNKAIIAFFDVEPNTESTVTTTYRDGRKVEEVKLIPVNLPLLQRFAKSIDICMDTLNEWAKPENEKKYPGFSDSLKKAKDLQESILITNGLQSLYQPAFAIFTAKNIMGWRDKQEITGDPDRSINVRIVSEDA